MQYKGIDLTEAIMCNVKQEAAESYIDMRIDKKKKPNQRTFDQNMRRAQQCELSGICTATQAVDLCASECWTGVTVSFIKNRFAREAQAEMQANMIQQTQLRYTPQSHTLTDHSWATGAAPQEPQHKLLN